MNEDMLEQTVGGPVRVVRVKLSNGLSAALLGRDVETISCRLVFRNMLPAPPEARLLEVLPHGLSLVFDQQPPVEGEPTGMLVPWGQISYITHE